MIFGVVPKFKYQRRCDRCKQRFTTIREDRVYCYDCKPKNGEKQNGE